MRLDNSSIKNLNKYYQPGKKDDDNMNEFFEVVIGGEFAQQKPEQEKVLGFAWIKTNDLQAPWS